MKRFAPDDTLPPGPGQYPLPQSVNVKNAKQVYASYASQTERNDTMVVPGSDAPGVGKYHHEEKTSFGQSQI